MTYFNDSLIGQETVIQSLGSRNLDILMPHFSIMSCDTLNPTIMGLSFSSCKWGVNRERSPVPLSILELCDSLGRTQMCPE